ncbi:MAG: glycerol-3-phosphate 1-O-acyltransferase PlsY [Gemmobacter sp.]
MPDFTSAPLALLLAAAVGYVLGSIPFGIVLARVFGLGDLRRIGSGNIGATNVLRTGNRVAAALTLILDGAKGAIAVLLARAALGEDAAQLAGVAAFLGHLFPVWLGFRGGKGVATFLGTLLALAWPAGLLACATWLVVATVSRYSSLSALVAAALSPLWLWLTGAAAAGLAVLLMVALIFTRHETNIRRLLSGEEPKIGRKAG